jgi:hypothetical protein
VVKCGVFLAVRAEFLRMQAALSFIVLIIRTILIVCALQRLKEITRHSFVSDVLAEIYFRQYLQMMSFLGHEIRNAVH